MPQTSENDSSEDSEVDNLEIHFADLLEGSKSQLQVFLLPTNFVVGQNDVTNTAWLPNTVSEVSSIKTNFFRIADTSDAETLVGGKAECLLAIGKDKKLSSLEWPKPCFIVFLYLIVGLTQTYVWKWEQLVINALTCINFVS